MKPPRHIFAFRDASTISHKSSLGKIFRCSGVTAISLVSYRNFASTVRSVDDSGVLSYMATEVSKPMVHSAIKVLIKRSRIVFAKPWTM
jgi:hypothetical protein